MDVGSMAPHVAQSLSTSFKLKSGDRVLVSPGLANGDESHYRNHEGIEQLVQRIPDYQIDLTSEGWRYQSIRRRTAFLTPYAKGWGKVRHASVPHR